MQKLISLVPVLFPAIALASGASDEPSILEAVIPFAVIGLLIIAIMPHVAKKKK